MPDSTTQKVLYDLEVNRLLDDIKGQLIKTYKAQPPECSKLYAKNGRWFVWVGNYGWVQTSELLRGINFSDIIPDDTIIENPMLRSNYLKT